MLAAGPATIATRRLQVARLPVRVRAERVAELGEALLGRGARRGRERRAAAARPRGRRARASAAVEVVAVERALDAVDGAGERRRLRDRAREAPLGVVRDRAVHPGDGHEAAERDRPDAVLDPVARRLRRSPAGSRRRTGAGAGRRRATRRSARPRGRGSGSARPRIAMKMLMPPPTFPARGAAPPRRPRRARRDRAPARRRPRRARPRRARAMSRKPIRPSRNAVDRDLVRRVERARIRAAALAGLARERAAAGNALEIGRLELEREPRREVEARAPGSRGAPG